MITILTLNSYRSPVRTIGAIIKEQLQTDSVEYSENNCVNYGILISGPSVLVRYGYTGRSDLDSGYDLVINKPEAISAASNKFQAIVAMREHGIPVVPFVLPRDYLANEEIRETFGSPIVGRKFIHFGGHDLRLIYNRVNIPVNRFNPNKSSDYLLKFIPHTKEYRGWFWNTRTQYDRGKVVILKVAEKVDSGRIDRTRLRRSKRILKNHKNGYIYEYHENIPAEIRDLTKRSAELFDLDFGAVDIMENLDNGEFYVLEVNTAPGCSSKSTSDKIADRIIKAQQFVAQN